MTRDRAKQVWPVLKAAHEIGAKSIFLEEHARSTSAWAEVKAYSEGQELQFRDRKGGGKWLNFLATPRFDPDYEYRVKPEPRRVFGVFRDFHLVGSRLTQAAAEDLASLHNAEVVPLVEEMPE